MIYQKSIASDEILKNVITIVNQVDLQDSANKMLNSSF